MKSSGLCARAAISFFAALLAAFGILGSTASLAQAGRLLQPQDVRGVCMSRRPRRACRGWRSTGDIAPTPLKAGVALARSSTPVAL